MLWFPLETTVTAAWTPKAVAPDGSVGERNAWAQVAAGRCLRRALLRLLPQGPLSRKVHDHENEEEDEEEADAARLLSI